MVDLRIVTENVNVDGWASGVEKTYREHPHTCAVHSDGVWNIQITIIILLFSIFRMSRGMVSVMACCDDIFHFIIRYGNRIV